MFDPTAISNLYLADFKHYTSFYKAFVVFYYRPEDNQHLSP